MNRKINNGNRNNENRKKKEEGKEKQKSEFEFCKICRLDHDEGPRHKYFPKHKQSLSVFLSRFQSKLADVRFFLRNPSLLRPEHASRNRLWCVFCDADLVESDSSFACENAINHLASEDHLKKLKHFLWKNGGGMDRVDTFRISEADVAKWEKKCKALKDGATPAGNGSCQQQIGPSNDIHYELEQNHENINKFERKDYVFDPSSSNVSNSVVPLQYFTNEYQISHSGLSPVPNVGQFAHGAISYSPVDAYSGANSWSSNDLAGYWNTQQSLGYKTLMTSNNLGNRVLPQVDKGERLLTASSSQGSETLAELSAMGREKSGGNVHTGAPPPWFEVTEEDQKPSGLVSLPVKLKKSQKLNPKRVGAAWAEKRKMELEMEKRGEIVKSDCDASWLPNFGRVWQSGTRKESRKQFEKEKKKLPHVETYSEERQASANVEPYLEEIPVQPYTSKRMIGQKETRQELVERQKLPHVERHSEEKQKVSNIGSQSVVLVPLQPYISKRMRRDAST